MWVTLAIDTVVFSMITCNAKRKLNTVPLPLPSIVGRVGGRATLHRQVEVCAFHHNLSLFVFRENKLLVCVRVLRAWVFLRFSKKKFFSKKSFFCGKANTDPPATPASPKKFFPWRAIGSRNQKKAEKREKKKRKKLGTVRLRRYLFPTLLYF